MVEARFGQSACESIQATLEFLAPTGVMGGSFVRNFYIAY